MFLFFGVIYFLTVFYFRILDPVWRKSVKGRSVSLTFGTSVAAAKRSNEARL